MIVLFHLCEMSQTGKSTERESWLQLPRARNGGDKSEWGVTANGEERVSFWDDEYVLKLHDGGGCTTL